MRSIPRAFSNVAILTLCLAMVACATPTRTVLTTDASGHAGSTFSNFLVIGVANDYEGRAMFERKLVSALRRTGADATAHHVAAGGNKPIDREGVEELVAANGFDAVLISRVLNRESDAVLRSGSTGGKAIRKDGRPINLFRYEYEELNEPMILDIDLSVTLATELFETADKAMIWGIESTISDKDMIEDLIDEAVDTIVRRLKGDRLIGQ